MFTSFFQKLFYYNRDKYENFLEDKNSLIGKLGNFLLDLSVIISILIIVLESSKPFPELFGKEFFIVTFIISTIFLFDYLYRFIRSKDKKAFLNSILNFIDLVSFLPFFISIIFIDFIDIEFLVVFRVFRVFRALRLLRNIPLTFGFVKALKTYRDEYKAVLLMFLIITFVVSTLVYEIETGVNPEFSSISKALWWGIVTAATVGYGDIYPITPMGRFVGSIVIFLGPALLSIIGAITVFVFTEVAHTREKARKGKIKQCNVCKIKNPGEANYCINCGNNFNEILKIPKL